MKEVNMSEEREPRGYKTMSEDATKEQHEAEGLSHVVQTLTEEQQVGCLHFLFGYMAVRPEWAVMKEGMEFYLRESGLVHFTEWNEFIPDVKQ